MANTENVQKYNPYHDSQGRFASANGGGGGAAGTRSKNSWGKRNNGGWTEGRVDGYSYQAKVYADTSRFGINGGTVSKLLIKDGEDNVVANYDRGWDVIPEGKAKKVLDRIVNHYDAGHISKRYDTIEEV